MLITITIATFLSTLAGGLFALRFKDKLHLILGFSAGAIIGLAFFDLLPEALDLGNKFYSIGTISSIIALGFMAYMVLDRFVILHSHHEHHDDGHDYPEASESRGIFGAGSLTVHSFLDGIAIGLAFQISASVGAIVAIAVLVHDFSDGINTVNLILKNKGKDAMAFKWLIADAIAPLFGVLSTLFFTLKESGVGIVLALFTGFFLYIGATDLLPESHHNHPRVLTTLMTIIGFAVMYVAIRLASF